MRKELEDALIAIDPVFLRETSMSETESCMYWGFECGDGWYEPLKKLVEGTRDLNARLKEKNTRIVAKQIKEKWGRLTIYHTIEKVDPDGPDFDCKEETAESRKLLGEVIEEASELCEECGAEVPLVATHGWLSYICEECAKARGCKYHLVEDSERVWKTITLEEFSALIDDFVRSNENGSRLCSQQE